MPKLHVKSLKINNHSLIIILISVIITLLFYVFFFNLVTKDKNNSWQDNNITSIVNKIPKFNSNNLVVGDLYMTGTNEKVDVNKFKQEIRDYYLNELNFKSEVLSENINVKNPKEIFRDYQWNDVYSKDNENYVVMFYLPSNLLSAYHLYEYQLPSLNSTIDFLQESDWNGILIKDKGVEINISGSLNGDEAISFKSNKLVQVKKQISEYNIYRYETRLEDGTYNYIYGDNNYISFENSCGNTNAPCGFLRLPYFNVICNVSDRSDVSICDEFVNSIKMDRRSWEVMDEFKMNSQNNKFVPFQ